MPNILVVDDSISVRKALERILEPHGHVVTVAASAEEALDKLDGATPDLIVSDVVMPGLDGYALAEEVRRGTPGMPLLLISGIVDDEVRARAAAVGAAAVVRKPFTPADLLPAIARALAGPEAGAPDGDGADGVEILLDILHQKPGVESVFGFAGDATLEHAVGAPLDDPETFAAYVRLFLNCAGVLGAHLDEPELSSIALEYGGRTLLLASHEGGNLGVVLRDAGTLGMVRFLLRKHLGRPSAAT